MRRFLLGLFLGLATVGVLAQNTPQPLQNAITQLTTGVTPFTTLGVVSGGYINFNAGRGVTGYGIRDNAGTIQVKNSGGVWAGLSGGDLVATYLIQTADASLPNAQVLGTLSTGLLFNTTSTGVASIYIGSACTNQFVRSLSGAGVATCNTVNLATDTTGTLGNTVGGTGQNSSAWSAIPTVSSGTWGQYGGTTCTNQVVAVLSALGVATCRTITSAYVDTSVAQTGVDMNTSFQVTATHLASALPVAQGGTALASYTIGDILYASGATTIAKLADTAVGSYLRSGGVATAPLWSTLTLPNAATQGDLFYASAANTMSNLVDVTVGSYLRSGGASTAPLWSTVVIPNTATAGDVWIASGANTMTATACATAGTVFIGGAPPSCSATVTATTVNVGAQSLSVSPLLVLTNTAAYAQIVSTNSETYFAIGSDGLIPSGRLNAAKHRASIVLRGVYGVNGATDTLILKVKLCTVSGCGSGTVQTLAATAAVTPGAAVANQGWETLVDVNVYTAGAPGAVDAQGFTRLALTSTTAAPDIDMQNSGTIAIDTTVNEYVSVSATFNNNSGLNGITLRNLGIYVY